jgi:thiol-disulfide isomerase/thioredoxin
MILVMGIRIFPVRSRVCRASAAACLVCLWFGFIAPAHASTGIVEEVRGALAQNQVAAADTALRSYREQNGVTPEYLEALSWMARGSLALQDYSRAQAYAEQAAALTTQQLKGKSLDSNEHFATAMGASLEVQAQVLEKEGKHPQAVALLQRGLATYGKTSIAPRLRKNLNLLTMVGSVAPPLKADSYLGTATASLSNLKGSPVLLFFWAHWCSDCKAESPIVTRLRSEYATKGLAVVAPTQFYGYTAQKENASPAEERTWIERVWQQFYPGLQDVPAPLSQANFNAYGASTTPTLVLVDRAGKVSMYHPGAMSYNDLRDAIQKVTN